MDTSLDFGPVEAVSQDDAEAAIFAVCQCVDVGDRAIDSAASCDRIPSAGSSLGR